MKNYFKNSAGFTLIEMVISLTIMAVLTVLSSQSIQQAIKAKVSLTEQVDDMSKVRDALRVIERDVNLAYHYQDIELEFLAEVACRSKPSSPGTGVPAPAVGSIPAPTASAQSTQACLDAFPTDPKTKQKFQHRKDPTTHFVGTEDSMSFGTSNVGRLSSTEVIADFAKIGYSLRGCKRADGTSSAGQCLVRRFSNLLEGDITKGGKETVLLEDVGEFKLRYFGKGKQDWNNSWDSVNGDGATKGNFPQAVEISITTEIQKGPTTKPKKISMQLVAAVRFPNNKEKASSSPNSGAPSQ